MNTMIESFGAVVLEKLVTESVNKIPELRERHKNNNFFGKMVRAYSARVKEEIGSIKILGMNRPVPLRDL